MKTDCCGCPISTCGTFHQPGCSLYQAIPAETTYRPASLICPSCAALRARCREAESKLAASEMTVEGLVEESRKVCGALGEFYANGGGTALEKIVFFREDNRVTRAENERLRADLRAATGELMDLAHSKPRPIRFYEEDGTERVLEWEVGDESAGILAGYVLTDASDSEYAKLQARLALLENLAEAYICESECLCRDDESRCLRDRLRAALKAKEGK